VARHTIQVAITKSSCSPTNYEIGDRTRFTPNPVGDLLYMQRIEIYGVKYYRLMALGWELPLEVENKKIAFTDLYLYSTKVFDHPVGYEIVSSFSEGGSLGPIEAFDGAISDGFTTGWNVVNIPGADTTNVLFGQIDYTASPTLEVSEVHSHRNDTYQPYVIITYDDLPPEQPTGLTPSAGTLNPRAVIRFSWKHNSPEGAAQKAFELQWSSNGGSSWTTVSQTSTNEYYDMPANTLPASGTITWRVRTTDINDEVSEYNTTAFTAGVVPQKAPLAIAPIGTYKNKATVIRFEWVFLGGATGETQSKFDLDYSTNNGSTWTTISQTTANKYYDLAANTLDIGSVVWRVRTYNEYDEVSPYSAEKYFAVIGTPGAPSIGTISNNSRPLISWTSSDQVLIDLEITQGGEVIYSTGISASIEKSHQVTEYLEDGTYTVRIRIANAFEMWSSWAEKSFALNPTRPAKPTISIGVGSYSLLLSVGDLSDTNLILRDGVTVGEVKQGLFIDYTCGNGTSYSYVARVIDADGNHSDSDPVTGVLTFRGNTIATASSPGEYLVIKNGFSSPIEKVESMDSAIALIPFDGRELPVAEYSGHRTRSKTVAAFVSKEELSTMKALIRQFKPLIFRDNNGDVMVGAVAGLQSRQNYFGYEVSFIINEIEV